MGFKLLTPNTIALSLERALYDNVLIVICRENMITGTQIWQKNWENDIARQLLANCQQHN